VFGSVGDNLMLWKEASTFKYKNTVGFTGGIVQPLDDRWSAVGFYDYSARELDPTGEPLYVNEYTVSSSYLLNQVPTDKFRISLLAGLQITDGNIPTFGTYLGFVNGLLLSYDINTDIRAFIAGTVTLGEKYQIGKVRAGISYPLPF
jgi:hypothetical protein